MPAYPGFPGGSAPSQRIATSERTVNYVESVEAGQQSTRALYPTPQCRDRRRPRAAVGDINASAGLVAAERAFVVIGAGLYEVFANASIVRRGTVQTGLAPAQLSFNGMSGGHLLVASGGHAYCYVLATNTPTQVLTGEAGEIGMLDGYFLALNATTGKLRLSNLLDGLTWDPTQFALRAPATSGRTVRQRARHWLLGRHTGDVWFDAGGAAFRCAMRQGLTVQYGVVAPARCRRLAEVFWLTRVAREGAGLVAQPAPTRSR